MVLSSGSVIQVTNISPSVSTEQIRTLFSFLGTLKDLVIYPSSETCEETGKVCFIRFVDPTSVLVAQHLTNTVLHDRAMFVKPVRDGKIPDEAMALKLAHEGHTQSNSNSGVVSQMFTLDGVQSIRTIDPRLNALGLPQYPLLPANLDPSKIEETRRTVAVANILGTTTPEQILEFFSQFGDVKYVRMTTREEAPIKSALVEFTDQSSVANALQSTDTAMLNGSQIKITHATSNILKPVSLLNSTRELVSSRRSSKSRSPSVSSHSRHHRSPSYHRHREPRSPHRSSRRRSSSRERSRRRSSSRERDRRYRDKSRRSRSRSKQRSSRRRDHDRRRSRSRDRSLERRSRDKSRRDRDRDRERDRDRSPRREKDRSSRHDRDRDRHDRHRSSRSSHRRDEEAEFKLEKEFDADSKIVQQDQDDQASAEKSADRLSPQASERIQEESVSMSSDKSPEASPQT